MSKEDAKSDDLHFGNYDEPVDKKPPVTFMTCEYFPQSAENHQIWFGATVSARSVKIVSPKTTERDTWWQELRKEIEKNVQAVNCTHVLGYREYIRICESVLVLSACGTAIKVKKLSSFSQITNLRHQMQQLLQNDLLWTTSISKLKRSLRCQSLDLSPSGKPSGAAQRAQRVKEQKLATLVKVADQLCKLGTPCHFCHDIWVRKDTKRVYNHQSRILCLECQSDYVPEMIVATTPPPAGLNVIGAPKLVEARMFQARQSTRALKSEVNATQISESVFFMEYNLHAQLINKIKVMGKNSIFNLHVRIQVNEDNIMGMASGTALTLRALPIPSPISIKGNKYFINKNMFSDFQQDIERIQRMAKQNVEVNFRMPILRLRGLSYYAEHDQVFTLQRLLKAKFEQTINSSFDSPEVSPLLPLAMRKQTASQTVSDHKPNRGSLEF